MANLAASVGPASHKAIQDACSDTSRLLREFYYRFWDCGTGEERWEAGRTSMDGARHSKLYWLYHETARILWNGHEAMREQVDNLVSNMPATKHVIQTLDVHPLQSDAHWVASVHGHCKYDQTTCRTFHHVFIIWKDRTSPETKHWIMYDCFRWLSEEDATYGDDRRVVQGPRGKGGHRR